MDLNAEMPAEILEALGFRKKSDEMRFDGEYWTHERSCGQFYFHILTPAAVSDALIEIGHNEFRRRAGAEISSINME